ncbi:YcdB/YcdC domain-containing protein [Paenibacillus sp. sgz500958]|uniref:YcdB/YcdC domain-containing protein n=1 Tax=Paenibacillus sp. sgz500958 TaxID=3242475 RepID=UPI0036D3A85E
MGSHNHHFVHQKVRTALVTTVALALLLPAGLAGADSVSSSAVKVTNVSVSANSAPSAPAAADPAKAKITKEQAIAKLKELFPVLKDATVNSVQLGTTNSYPPPANQMIWNIQWEYRTGNSGYGFGSEVDAITGDVINTYISMPSGDNIAYYPPKLSQSEALEKAKEFVAKAAPSIKNGELQLDDNSNTLYSSNSALFGPVQYNFNFRVLRNGLLSTSESISVTMDGNGQVTQFYKPSSNFAYPSSQPKITLEQAEKKFSENFKVELVYIPVYKDGTLSNWILSWRPQDSSVYALDAQTGKIISGEGMEYPTTSVSYEAVPQGKVVFQPKAFGRELTADEAAKLVQSTAVIPNDRKLTSSFLSDDYQNKDKKLWRLNWTKNGGYMGAGFPEQSTAEVDSVTGEIRQFQVEQFSYPEKTPTLPVPAGTKKLTSKEAKVKAVEWINRLYNKASANLKLVEHGGTWSVLPNGNGYRYDFVQFYKGVPISGNNVSLTIDLYGRLQSYSNYQNADTGKINQEPTPVVTRQEALESYLKQYKLKLQYSQFGGYMTNNIYADSSVKLVYSPNPVEPSTNYEVLDAVTGKWSNVYAIAGLPGAPVAATDITGHKAEKELRELVKYSVIVPDENGKVNPDQEITVGEWLTFIAKASTPYYSSYSSYNNSGPLKPIAGVQPENSYYNAVSFSVERQWLSKDAVVVPDNKLTKEQLAVLLTSFVKYSKLSTFLAQDAVLSQFNDTAAITSKGAAALVLKLGLLQGENGNFNPQQAVTRAQAAVIIMKLVELQGKTDQMIAQ